MKLKVVLIISAVYMTVIGIGHFVAPVAMSLGIFPADSSAGVASFLRHYSAVFIAFAVMNFMASNSEASSARTAVVFANIVALGLAAILDIFVVLSGAGLAGLVPASTNLLIAFAFIWAGLINTSVPANKAAAKSEVR